ncbi:MAG TPA: GNAT family N-acetyltransferase [Devosiaceae bacterium]|nr:GNAT family N-acetyltransferase [Devosiaceae bacterium]
MPELIYRKATSADLPFMVDLIAVDDVSGSAETWAAANAPLYEAALAAIDADPNQELIIAELDGAAVGTLQLTFIPGIMRRGMWRAVVESVHIVPEQRNKGLGKQMMGWAAERCRARDCGLVQLTSSKKRLDAHRFYRTLGYDQSHEGFKLYL